MIVDFFLKLTVSIAVPLFALWGFIGLVEHIEKLPFPIDMLFMIFSASATLALIISIWAVCWLGVFL